MASNSPWQSRGRMTCSPPGPERGQTALHLRNQVKLDSSSTAKLDLLATWQETRDDPAKPGYETVPLQAHVLELPVSFDGLPGRLTDPALQDIYQLIDEGYVLQFDTDFRNRDSFSIPEKVADRCVSDPGGAPACAGPAQSARPFDPARVWRYEIPPGDLPIQRGGALPRVLRACGRSRPGWNPLQ